jgi:hypothetical protein
LRSDPGGAEQQHDHKDELSRASDEAVARHKTSLNFNLRFGPEKRIYLGYGRDTVSSQEVGQKAASHISKRMARSDHELTVKGIAPSCQPAEFSPANFVRKKEAEHLCVFLLAVVIF